MRTDEERKRLDEAQRQLLDHPAERVRSALDELTRMLNGVYLPNWNELSQLLDAASHNEELAIELIQNVHSPIVRDDFEKLLSRRLHNHLASTASLVDHVRRIVKRLPSSVAPGFGARTDVLTQAPEVGFVRDLRNFTLHRALPFLGHKITISNMNTAEQEFESEVELSVQELLRWDRWTPSSRSFISSQGEAVRLRAVIDRQGQLVWDHNMWLGQRMADYVGAHVDEINQLRLGVVCAQFGVSPEVGHQMMVERAARDEVPPPIG
ncbi:MAG: hypothetical protein ABI595_15875 [Actinomycetota bacterium]